VAARGSAWLDLAELSGRGLGHLRCRREGQLSYGLSFSVEHPAVADASAVVILPESRVGVILAARSVVAEWLGDDHGGVG